MQRESQALPWTPRRRSPSPGRWGPPSHITVRELQPGACPRPRRRPCVPAACIGRRPRAALPECQLPAARRHGAAAAATAAVGDEAQQRDGRGAGSRARQQCAPAAATRRPRPLACGRRARRAPPRPSPSARLLCAARRRQRLRGSPASHQPPQRGSSIWAASPARLISTSAVAGLVGWGGEVPDEWLRSCSDAFRRASHPGAAFLSSRPLCRRVAVPWRWACDGLPQRRGRVRGSAPTRSDVERGTLCCLAHTPATTACAQRPAGERAPRRREARRPRPTGRRERARGRVAGEAAGPTRPRRSVRTASGLARNAAQSPASRVVAAVVANTVAGCAERAARRGTARWGARARRPRPPPSPPVVRRPHQRVRRVGGRRQHSSFKRRNSRSLGSLTAQRAARALVGQHSAHFGRAAAGVEGFRGAGLSLALGAGAPPDVQLRDGATRRSQHRAQQPVAARAHARRGRQVHAAPDAAKARLEARFTNATSRRCSAGSRAKAITITSGGGSVASASALTQKSGDQRQPRRGPGPRTASAAPGRWPRPGPAPPPRCRQERRHAQRWRRRAAQQRHRGQD